MRNGNAKPSKEPLQSRENTERSEQKVQGHAPGQGQGAKPLRSKFLVRLRSQEMGRASIGVSLQAVQREKEECQIFFYHIAISKNKTAPLYYILIQSKIRKERSDFAAWQTMAKTTQLRLAQTKLKKSSQ